MFTMVRPLNEFNTHLYNRIDRVQNLRANEEKNKHSQSQNEQQQKTKTTNQSNGKGIKVE